MLHSEYLKHLGTHFDSSLNDNQFWNSLKNHQKEFTIIANLNFDPAIEILKTLYSPVKRAPYRDPVSISRSLTLMTLLKISSITKWVKETRSSSLWAILAGFAPNDTPGIGTYYDFFKRIIDGPYSKPCEHKVQRSDFICGTHKRNLKSEKEAKKDDLDPNQSQSEKLAKELLAQASKPRPEGFQKILEDLLIRTGLLPSIEQGLLQDLHNLVVSGDGSILETAASSHGKPTCSCRSEKIYKCGHVYPVKFPKGPYLTGTATILLPPPTGVTMPTGTALSLAIVIIILWSTTMATIFPFLPLCPAATSPTTPFPLRLSTGS